MKEENLAKRLAQSPFSDSHFTPQLKNKILTRTSTTSNNRKFTSITVATLLPVAIVLFSFFIFAKRDSLQTIDDPSYFKMATASMSEQKQYYKNGQLLISLSTQHEVRAGEMSGYIFHFEEPFENFFGKLMTIQAVNLRSGLVETVSSEVIQEPSIGYLGLERYALRFALPLDGIWRFEVKLDDKLYGKLMINMQSPSWEITPMFQSDVYWLRGFEKQVGFIDAGFKAGMVQKYIWHFWGTEEKLNGPFEVKAIKEGSDSLINVYASNPLSSANALGGPLNGADRALPTSMMLPEVGRWRLLPYVHGRLLDPIVVEVK
ncbi:DUF4871 domain-containing protein [Paenibacillus chondroitinus]|uniref:DUF4871 domain-containing protein n=1 Tax=Paenibacillus chondroitinus TaxID=59842 RepID=A0ABU6D9M4_9BACL|nr:MULTISPECIES: DUF4871 domain-containing protein [Paenibacillus]MCY9659819.1 DUF4871 domain-containing protein [Paenibacillus anseongense]MEB4794002.1 DUF4871 domain-containing protein [Paenibacillus chondroitinus]